MLDFLRGLLRDAGAAIRGWSWRRWLALVAAAVLLVAVAAYAPLHDVVALRAHADHPWFPLAFFCLYVVATQFRIPRTVFTLSSGLIFGPAKGIVLAVVATTLSAAISLVIVRRLLGEWMRPHLTHPAVAGIDARLRERGWLAVAALRMIAGIPFCVLNYTAALTSVPLASYTAATLIGAAPGTIAVVLLGNSLVTHASLASVAVTVGLALLGVTGLILDARIPVKAER